MIEGTNGKQIACCRGIYTPLKITNYPAACDG